MQSNLQIGKRKHKNDNELHNGKKLTRYKNLPFWCPRFRNSPYKRKHEREKSYETVTTLSAEIKNTRSRTSTAPFVFMAWCLTDGLNRHVYQE